MTLKFNNVYLNETAAVAGFIEARNPIGPYFDKTYKDYYMDDNDSVEYSEVVMQKDAMNILFNKTDLSFSNIDLFLGGDLQNQIAASCYSFDNYSAPFLGLYSACATSIEELIIASNFIDSNSITRAICNVSSHNLASEKQYRNPIEYGALKPNTATFTSTGATSVLLSGDKKGVKVSAGTIGSIYNFNQKDPNHMGAAMAYAAAETIYEHLKETNTSVSDYDLILTGDLGLYGSAIFRDYMLDKYKIKLDNHNDCGIMLYDIRKEPDISAGGSGPVCSALVNFSYIFSLLKKKEVARVMLVATGALFNPTFLYQKHPILGISHAVTLEVIK